MKQKITYAEYMANSTELFWPFYSQFVTPSIKECVLRRFGAQTLLASRDPYLNDIPLASWDHMSFGMKEQLSLPAEFAGNYGPAYEGKKLYSLAHGVCILKQAAREVIDDLKQSNSAATSTQIT